MAEKKFSASSNIPHTKTETYPTRNNNKTKRLQYECKLVVDVVVVVDLL